MHHIDISNFNLYTLSYKKFHIQSFQVYEQHFNKLEFLPYICEILLQKF